MLPREIIAYSSYTVSEIERLTGLDSLRLTKIDKYGILGPSKPGVRGHQEREYDLPRAVAAMVVADSRLMMGIDRERQLGPIVSSIVDEPAFQPIPSERTQMTLSYEAFRRYRYFDGRQVVASDQPSRMPFALVVDLHAYLARISLIFALDQVHSSVRDEWLLNFADYRESDWENHPEGPAGREAGRLAMEILENPVRPREDYARMLGCDVADIAIPVSGV